MDREKGRPKITKAMLSVLRSHAAVHPRPVAWTSDLCRYRTWRRCYDAGLLHGGRLTEAGINTFPEVAERVSLAAARKDGSSPHQTGD